MLPLTLTQPTEASERHPLVRGAVGLVGWIHKYRIHVALIYTQAAAALLHFTGAGGTTSETVILLAAFFFWQLGVYLFNKTCDLVEDAISQPKEMLQPGEIAVVRVLSLVMLAAPLGLALWLRRDPLPALALFVGAILYSQPLPGLRFRIKNLFLVKELYSSIPGWAGSMAALIAVYASRPVPVANPGVQTFLIRLILSTLAVEFMWDIRDIDGDRAAKVNSPAVKFGAGFARAAALAFVATPAIWTLFQSGTISVQQWLLPAGILVLPRRARPSTYHLLIDLPFIAAFWLSF